ncbi:MAG: hypothetical protein IT377_09580 [Polyangiaceae bacterium]|nr:hypothetical protein [Polyangiaceae bacterium]
MPEKLDQIAEELADVCGWSAVAFARVEALRARAEILEATHRPTPVAAGPIELQAFGVDPTTAGVLPGCPDPSDRAGGRDEVRRRHAGRSTGARSEVWPMTPGESYLRSRAPTLKKLAEAERGEAPGRALLVLDLGMPLAAEWIAVRCAAVALASAETERAGPAWGLSRGLA